ncbi:MAG: YqgE/AlgH family protein [Lactobacillus sp.]|nr:YqgE/AlgH family protein [Lactobacillus sp.]
MANFNDDYLTGKCLISTPKLDDNGDVFARSVVYICSHNSGGAMGFILNKRLKEFSFSDLAEQLPIAKPSSLNVVDIHSGGPLEKVRGFVIHSTDYIKEDTVVIDDVIAISSSIDILSDIAFGTGPKDNIIALGYASWAPKQLEQEIINNDWLVLPTSPELVFRTKDEDKWDAAVKSIGIDLSRISTKIGHA